MTKGRDVSKHLHHGESACRHDAKARLAKARLAKARLAETSLTKSSLQTRTGPKKINKKIND